MRKNVPGSASARSANSADAGEDLVAVGAGQAGDAGMAGEHRVEGAAGAAVGVGDEHRTAGRFDEHRLDSRGTIRSGRLWRCAGR